MNRRGFLKTSLAAPAGFVLAHHTDDTPTGAQAVPPESGAVTPGGATGNPGPSVFRLEDFVLEIPQDELVPMDVLEKVANAHAFELWGEDIGRGEPFPLSDADGLYAYVFPFIRGSRQFPSNDAVFSQVRGMRSKHGVRMGADDMPEGYVADLQQYGNGFGAICVAATYSETPVLWMTHFLPGHYLTIESAKEEARRQIGGDPKLISYYYVTPEEQHLEFGSGANTVLLDVAAPGRKVTKEVLKRRRTDPRSEEHIKSARDSWNRLASLPSGGKIPPGGPAGLSPGKDIAPKGYEVDDVSRTHTEMKIAYWELIPKVDHTTKNWCVPSSWAMLLGFYDNYVPGKGTILGYGRLIDYWYELTPGGPNLPNLIDDLLSSKGASAINGYSFPETHSGTDKTKQWNMLKAEVEAGRPCFFNIPGHTTLAFGYRVNFNGDRFAIVYDPPNPNVPTYQNEYNLQVSTGLGSVIISGGTDAENEILIEPDGGQTFYTSVPGEIIWFVWGASIKKTRISISEDGGNKWQVIANNVPTKGAWNGYAWIPGTSGTRVRAKVEGLTDSNVLIAADGSFKNFQVKPSPSASAWKKIWGPTDNVLASGVVGKTDLLVFAVPTSGDGIYRYDGTPMAWTKVGGPGKMFALDDYGHLYGLSPDGGGVFRYNGTPMNWTQVGGPTGAIYAGGAGLFATNPQSGEIWQYSGTPMSWTRIGGPGKMFAVDVKGRLYGVSPDGSAIFRYDGTPMSWTRIQQQSTTGIYAGGCGLYATGGSANDLFYFSLAPNLWAKVGGGGKMFAVDDTGRVYGLSPDAQGVFRYDGDWKMLSRWTKVGGAAGKIFAGGNGRLFATNPQSGDLMSFQ